MKRIILLFLPVLFLFACGGGKSSESVQENAVQTQQSVQHAEGAKIVLTQEQIQMAEIRAGEMQESNVSSSVMVNGVVCTPPNGTVHISLPYSGIIRKILVAPNSSVQAGQPLVELIGNDFITLQENYISAKGALQVVQKEFERQEQLIKEDATTPKIYEQTRADLVNAKARLAAAVASLESVGLSSASLGEGTVASSVVIKSPLSGTVNMENINIGDNIESGARLLTVISKAKLQLQLSAYEKDIKNIKLKDSVVFKTVGETTFLRKGIVTSIGSVVDPATRVLNVMMDVTSDVSDLAVGMYAVAKIKEGGANIHVMPETGVIGNGDKKYIYAMEETGFVPYEVITGIEENGFIEICNYESLPKQAKFVTYGAYYIRSQQERGEE